MEGMVAGGAQGVNKKIEGKGIHFVERGIFVTFSTITRVVRALSGGMIRVRQEKFTSGGGDKTRIRNEKGVVGGGAHFPSTPRGVTCC